jgi:acyl-CoA reductase-like NAD-dependent aldehyde dehydrogenase
MRRYILKSYRMWINGEWLPADSGKTYQAVNPATEEIIAKLPLGDRSDVDKAVSAAKKALPAWSGKTQAERSHILEQAAAKLREHINEFAEIEALDHGTPLKIGKNILMPGAIDSVEFAAQTSRAIHGEYIAAMENALSYVKPEPIGVCGIITPWNVPLNEVTSLMSATIATGNTCVVKPPSIDSLSALRMAEILQETALPPGVVNVITGPGGTAGEALATHPDIAAIGFIGSGETGKRIMSCAAASVKNVSLELGGKNPFIVLHDADVNEAVDGAVFASFFNSGMVCAAPGRYYVHDKIYDEFVEKFINKARRVIVGDPFDENTFMGPVVSAEHRDSVERYIESGLQEGASLVMGGKRLTEPPFDKGYWIMPTVFTGVTQNMKIAREEIFGPVACMMRFTDEDEVVDLANDNTYGLTASVWTKDIKKGVRMADQINAGTVWVNEHILKLVELPHGGFNESGIGKEAGIDGIKEFLRKKLIHINLSEETEKPWHRL